MKKKLICIFSTFIAIVVIITIWKCFMRVDGNFATVVSIKYTYHDDDIDAIVTSEDDIEDIKKILKGTKYKDSPACGFSTDISITLSNDKESITFCPACDGCPMVRIDSSDYYIQISREQRNKLNEILKRYGMEFPCV